MGVRTIGLAVLALVVLLSACGRSGFQYLENTDSGVYAKIPEDWDVMSEGLVDFSLPGEDGAVSVLPGEGTLPWRAVFGADGDAGFEQVESLIGSIEIQPVDRRLRSELSVEGLLGLDPADPADDIEVLFRAEVTQGELSGLRLIYQTDVAGTPTMVDRMLLSDDRLTTLYEIRMICETGCFAANAAVIEEVMSTFTVEP